MRPFKKSRALLFLSVVLLLSIAALLFLRLRTQNILARNTLPNSSSRMNALPKIFLWAWERPEHLEFIDPRKIGVAFLAETIYLRNDTTVKRPRLQPLKVPTGTTLIAVVRIETVRTAPPVLSDRQRAELAEALAQVSRQPNISALQIDFDALQSERKFYRALLKDVRQRMPESMPLSITALASWCIFDNWLDDLPVDEAVPMIFDMGVDQQRINSYLETGGDFRAPLCRTSVGVSIEQPAASLSSTRRVYLFNSQPWTESTLRLALERSRQ